MTLEDWMRKRKLTDEAMAEKLNGAVSRSQISRIRRRKSIPSLATAKALQEVTKIPAARFLTEERV